MTSSSHAPPPAGSRPRGIEVPRDGHPAFLQHTTPQQPSRRHHARGSWRGRRYEGRHRGSGPGRTCIRPPAGGTSTSSERLASLQGAADHSPVLSDLPHSVPVEMGERIDDLPLTFHEKFKRLRAVTLRDAHKLIVSHEATELHTRPQSVKPPSER